jgi:hypothetical protein
MTGRYEVFLALGVAPYCEGQQKPAVGSHKPAGVAAKQRLLTAISGGRCAFAACPGKSRLVRIGFAGEELRSITLFWKCTAHIPDVSAESLPTS